MSTVQKMKYVFIADAKKKCIVADYPSAMSFDVLKDARTLFEKIVKCQYNKYEERNKIKTKEGNYFFLVTSDQMFFFVLADNEYSENMAFDFIDNIYTNKILKSTDEKGELTEVGVQKLKSLFTKFEKESETNHQIESPSNINNENEFNNCSAIHHDKVYVRIEDNAVVNNNDQVQEKFQYGGREEENTSMKQSRDHEKMKSTKDLFRKIKLYLIFFCFFVGIVLYIIIPFTVDGTGGLLNLTCNTTRTNCSNSSKTV